MKSKYPVKNSQPTINKVLCHILQQETASNQNDLMKLLETQGFKTNQSKISRLLRKLDAIKTRNSKGEVVYSLSKEPTPLSSANNVAGLVVDVVANENLVVIHTTPGSASFVARLLDYKRNEFAILGTVAGDDTIFVAPTSTNKLPKLITAIKEMLY